MQPFRRDALLVALLVALVSLVACGGSVEAPATESFPTATSPTGTAAPSPTGTPVTPTPQAAEEGFTSLDEARAEYLRLLEPSARAAKELSGLLDAPDPDAEELRRALRMFAVTTERFATGLEARAWPSEVAVPVEELTRQLLAHVDPYRRAAEGRTADDISRALRAVPPATAAEQVRDAFRRGGA